MIGSERLQSPAACYFKLPFSFPGLINEERFCAWRTSSISICYIFYIGICRLVSYHKDSQAASGTYTSTSGIVRLELNCSLTFYYFLLVRTSIRTVRPTGLATIPGPYFISMFEDL